MSAITVDETSNGTLTYLVAFGPDELPPVQGRDLQSAWDAARDAAAREAWGVARAFRFQRRLGEPLDLVLADPDACAWAAAIDARAALATRRGLSLCLRLLALVELLGRAAWTGTLCEIRRDGASLDPALLDAAARLPLTPHGGLDETRLRATLRDRIGGDRLPAPVAGG